MRTGAPPPEPRQVNPLVWRVMGVAAFGPMLATLDAGSINIALPTLSRELSSPLGHIQWVVTGYLLALALALPLSGWLVDLAGAKRVYLACFAVFVFAAALCGLATSAEMLIAMRLLQGVAGGLMAPMAQMLVARVARGGDLARMLGYTGMLVSAASMLGPVVAGLILQHASWRGLFFFTTVPMGIAAIAVAAALLPKDVEFARRPLDLRGLALVSPGLVFLIYGATRAAQPGETLLGWVLAGAGAAVLILFVMHARRAVHPLLDVRLFGRRVFAVSGLVQFLGNGVALGALFLLPMYYLIVRGETPSTTGLMLLPTGAGVMCALPLVARLMRRTHAANVLLGASAVTLLGTAPFVLTGADLPDTVLVAAQFVRGGGISGMALPTLAMAYSGLAPATIPMATTTLNIMQRIGPPITISGLAILLQAMSSHARAPTPAAIGAGFAVLCLMTAVVALASRVLVAGAARS